MTETKLPPRQEGVMRCMARFHQWPSGFVYGTASETARILDALAKKGLVEKTDRRVGRYSVYVLPAKA